MEGYSVQIHPQKRPTNGGFYSRKQSRWSKEEGRAEVEGEEGTAGT